MSLTVTSLPETFTFCLKKLDEHIKLYQEIIQNDRPWKTMFRSLLEDTYSLCLVLSPHFSSEQTSQFKILEKYKDMATHGRQLIIFTSKSESKFNECSLADSSRVIMVSCLVLPQLENFLAQLEHMDFERKVSSGEIKLLVTKDQLKDWCADTNHLEQLQVFVRENYCMLDEYFHLLDDFPSNLYQKYLLWAYPFDVGVEALPYFQHYVETYQQNMSGCDFSELINHVKNYTLYLDYVLYEYGQKQRGLSFVFDRCSWVEFDLDLLKKYKAISKLTTEKFVNEMLYCINHNNLKKPDQLHEMYVYLFGLVGITEMTIGAIQNYCVKHDLFQYACAWDIPNGLLISGTLTLSDEDIHAHVTRDEDGEIVDTNEDPIVHFKTCMLRAYETNLFPKKF